MKTYPRLTELLKKDIDSGMSLRGVCRKTKLHPNTVSAYLEGRAEPKVETLNKIADAYHVPVSWLRGDDEPVILGQHTPVTLSTEEAMARLAGMGVTVVDAAQTVVAFTRTIPVISCAQAGDNGFWLDSYPVGQGMEQIPCPAQVTDPNAFAFRVEGDSMIPRYYPGETVIVDTTKEVVNNDDVVVRLSDGRVMVKRYRRTNGTVLLESYNPAEDPIVVSPEEIKRCYKVVCRV